MKIKALLVILAGACLASTATAGIGDVYAVDLRATPNRLIVFPPSAPAQNVVGTVTPDVYAMDFDSPANTLYAVAVPSPFVFGTIDQTTGAWTPGPTVTGLGSSENTTGLSCDPTSETFYLSTVVSAGVNALYTLNPSTGVATLVGPMTGLGTELFIDIAISASGQMYTHDIATDALYSVNKATGACTLIGSTGLLANFAQGMDFDYATNTLYGTLYTGSGVGSFVSFNLTSGAATVLYTTTPWNAEMEMAVKSPIPEPASLSLLALLALLRRR